MSPAFASASSGESASLTPPALPRPPVLTCALTTTVPPYCSAAIARLGRRERHSARGHGDAVLGEQLFGLVLEQVHGASPSTQGASGPSLVPATADCARA